MKTNTLILLLAICFTTTQAYSQQAVTEYVDFNTYTDSTHNDLTNKFASNVSGFTQDTLNGITGGSLLVNAPGGTAQAYYCHRYLNGIGQVTTTSICFRYDSASVNRTSGGEAASIELIGNDEITTTLGWETVGGPSNWLNIYTGSWVYSNTGNPQITLIDSHWYKLQLSTNIIGGTYSNQVYIADTVFDLGVNGLLSPSFVKADTGTIYDLTYVNTPSIQVKIGAGNWGGGNHVDNFTFQGVKSADSCIALNTGIIGTNSISDLSIYPSPFSNNVTIDYSFLIKQSNPRLIICDILGQKLKTINLGNQFDKVIIDTRDLPEGSLIFSLYADDNSSVNKKVIKIN